MKRCSLLLASIAVTAVFLASSSVASAILLRFASEPGSNIQFLQDGSMSFVDEVPNSFNDFRITSSDSQTGAAMGLTGDIDGVFTLGAISGGDWLQYASVSGQGLLAISDGVGGVLTGTVSFGSIATFFQFGVFNLTSDVNLTNLTYTGANADLLAMASDGSGVVHAAFRGPIGASLSELVSSGRTIDSYVGRIRTAETGETDGTSGSGSITPVPEPSAALCFAIGGLVVSQRCRRRRS